MPGHDGIILILIMQAVEFGTWNIFCGFFFVKAKVITSGYHCCSCDIVFLAYRLVVVATAQFADIRAWCNS